MIWPFKNKKNDVESKFNTEAVEDKVSTLSISDVRDVSANTTKDGLPEIPEEDYFSRILPKKTLSSPNEKPNRQNENVDDSNFKQTQETIKTKVEDETTTITSDNHEFSLLNNLILELMDKMDELIQVNNRIFFLLYKIYTEKKQGKT